MKRFNTIGTAGKAVLRNMITSTFLLMFFTLTFTTAASAAELVVNGGFEEPVVPVGQDVDFGWMTYYGENYTGDPDCSAPKIDKCNDGTLVPGWSVFWTDDLLNNEQLNPGRLEIQSGEIDTPDFKVPPAYDGSLQKAELDSHHRVDDDGNRLANNNVTIAQVIPTCPLTAYEFSYAWQSRTDVIGDNDVRVVLDEETVAMHQQNLGWEKETIPFISNDTDGTLLLFGSIGTDTTLGMYLDDVSVIGPDGSYPEDCSLVCDEKPVELTLRYNGTDGSDHDQDWNQVIVFPKDVVGSFPENATILVYGHNKKFPAFLGKFDVSTGEFFTVSGPKNRIPPRLVFVIYRDDKHPEKETFYGTRDDHSSDDDSCSAGDGYAAFYGEDPSTKTRDDDSSSRKDDDSSSRKDDDSSSGKSCGKKPVQIVSFHTSCSQPLNAGDKFGGITVWSAKH